MQKRTVLVAAAVAAVGGPAVAKQIGALASRKKQEFKKRMVAQPVERPQRSGRRVAFHGPAAVPHQVD